MDSCRRWASASTTPWCAPINPPLEGNSSIDWLVPIIADAEAASGQPECDSLMKAMIRAGAAAVHFEDQLSSAKKCGHMGGKVLVPTQTPSTARCRAPRRDVMGNRPSCLPARTRTPRTCSRRITTSGTGSSSPAVEPATDSSR